MRFTDGGNGTVTDTKTGLIWQKTGSEEKMTWEEALEYANHVADGGSFEWRLPSIEELFSIVDFSRSDPSISPIFNCSSDLYWSSSTVVVGPDNAWNVGFGTGYVYAGYKTNSNYVRCVRNRKEE